MQFEIDVSGDDLLSKDYTICVANRDSIIKGFKFSEEIINILASRYGQGLYRYKKSKKDKSSLKIRLYCIIIYYIFKSIRLKDNFSLTICRDFFGREDDIKKTLKFLIKEKLGLKLEEIYFSRLGKDSNAHQYAYLMRKDKQNQMKSNYVKISLEEIEELLKK